MPKCYSYIRFSRPEQMRGASLRRQMEAADKWAAEHGMVIDESLTDLGLSAFRGLTWPTPRHRCPPGPRHLRRWQFPPRDGSPTGLSRPPHPREP